MPFKGSEITVEELSEHSFEGVDIALFSAGSGISKKFAPHAVKAGAVVIDNSSAFRMEADVPLVVPEVNGGALAAHRGVIANPNCVGGKMLFGARRSYSALEVKTAGTHGQSALRVGLTVGLTNPKSAVFFGSLFATILPVGVPAWIQAMAIAIVATVAFAWYSCLRSCSQVRRASPSGCRHLSYSRNST